MTSFPPRCSSSSLVQSWSRESGIEVIPTGSFPVLGMWAGCKFRILFVNSEYFSVCGAGQRKSQLLFLGKILANEDLWGLEPPRAPSRGVYPALEVTWMKSWWISMDLSSPSFSPHPFAPWPWKIRSFSSSFPWETTAVGSEANSTLGTSQIP